MVKDYAEHLGYSLVEEKENYFLLDSEPFQLIECVTSPELSFGTVSKDAGLLAGESIEKGVASCLANEIDALVTLPIQKESLYLAGWTYPGHTEMIAARCGSNNPLMIMEHQGLRVTLLTLHISVSEIPKYITSYRIDTIVKGFDKTLKRDFAVTNPKIALLSLNPHAGENGNIGTEEIDIYLDAIEELRKENITIEGPFAADGFFAHGAYKNYDGVVASYHDQGLTPLKLLANGGGVNFTGGLSIVRTSPDHGTAMDIAGKGMANPQSLIDAFDLAIEIVNNRKSSLY
ncbi:MAG: hypothetical protein Kapaf2KO_01400 [Candidatus Kapaibacteriales bacterium]